MAIRAVILLIGLALVGCSTVTLRNPQTGQTVTCGPYTTGLGSTGDAIREHDCVQDYKAQGFKRVPG